MTSSSSSLGDLPGLPPLASLFVTHFDDIKGQSVAYYVSMDGESAFAPAVSIPNLNPHLMLETTSRLALTLAPLHMRFKLDPALSSRRRYMVSSPSSPPVVPQHAKKTYMSRTNRQAYPRRTSNTSLSPRGCTSWKRTSCASRITGALALGYSGVGRKKVGGGGGWGLWEWCLVSGSRNVPTTTVRDGKDLATTQGVA
jgi:hypothetical protein